MKTSFFGMNPQVHAGQIFVAFTLFIFCISLFYCFKITTKSAHRGTILFPDSLPLRVESVALDYGQKTSCMAFFPCCLFIHSKFVFL